MAPQPRAFISYTRKDGEAFATALRRRLRAMDPEITLWQDRAELEGGIGWWKQIETALDQVRFLIIVMTPEAIASPNTQDEWRHVRRKGVIVYPVEGAPDRELDYAALPSWIRKAHFYDIGTPANEQWQNDKEWEAFVTHLRSDRQLVVDAFDDGVLWVSLGQPCRIGRDQRAADGHGDFIFV